MIVRHVSCTIDVARAASGSEERQKSFRMKRSPDAANRRRIRTAFGWTKTSVTDPGDCQCLDEKVEGSWAGRMETRRWFSGKWKRFIVDGIWRGHGRAWTRWGSSGVYNMKASKSEHPLSNTRVRFHPGRLLTDANRFVVIALSIQQNHPTSNANICFYI